MLPTPLVAQTVKDLRVMQETQVLSLGQDSSILVWRIPWTEAMGSKRVGHD